MDVLVIGAGGMGSVHARCWANLEDVRLSIYDREFSKAEILAKKVGGTAVKEPESAKERCELWDLCTPTSAHFEDLKCGLEKGKFVSCEKPLVRTLEQADALESIARSSKGTVAPCHVVRFFPQYKLAHKLIVDGKIGKPSAATLHRGGRTPSGSHNWFQDPKLSGGILLDLAIHEFDWLLWTLGPVCEVTSRSIVANGVTGTDYALTTLSFKNGAVATVESSWLDYQGFHTWFDIAASDGIIQHDSKKEAGLTHSQASGVSYESSRTEPEDPYLQQIIKIKESFVQKSEPPVTMAEGLAAVRVSLAAIESAASKKTILLSK